MLNKDNNVEQSTAICCGHPSRRASMGNDVAVREKRAFKGRSVVEAGNHAFITKWDDSLQSPFMRAENQSLFR